MSAKKFLELFRLYGPLVFWMVVIFCFSSQEGSGRQYYDFWMFIERKGAHVLEYAILTFLWIRTLNFSEFSLRKIIMYAALFSFSYAILDEFHQVFVFGREGKLFDVGVDMVGIVSVSCVYYCLFKHSVTTK